MTTILLEGFIADKNGSFDRTVPHEEGFSFIKELLRPVGTYLYDAASTT